jgi:hypothetical protein
VPHRAQKDPRCGGSRKAPPQSHCGRGHQLWRAVLGNPITIRSRSESYIRKLTTDSTCT